MKMPNSIVRYLPYVERIALNESYGHIKIFGIGNARRAAHSLIQIAKASNSHLYKSGTACAYGIPNSLCRLFSRYTISNRRLTSCISYEIKESLRKNGGSNNFYFILASNKISSHAQIAWKRLSHICSYNGPILPPISRIVCAVSLALTRSHLVAPGIFALIVGELAWTDITWAEAEGFPSKDTLYMHAQDGHVYLTSFIFSLLEGLILFLRSIYLAILFSPCIAMAPFADSFDIEFRKTWLRLVHLTLEKAGPAFIKWGQWAATRPDLFPSDLCTDLAALQTKAPAHGYDHTKRTVETAFGRKLPEIFEKFEEKPVASGSIAQVHRATLKLQYPGQHIRPILVAVKVRHPGVGEAIKRDLDIRELVKQLKGISC